MLILGKIKRYFLFDYHNGIMLKNVNNFKNIKINGKIYIKNSGLINIDKNVVINSGQKYNQVGYNDSTRITVSQNAILNIGENVGISNANIFCASMIDIGSNVMIGGGTNIWDTDFHSLNFKERIIENDSNILNKPIVIESGVFIGANCTILKGVNIGECSIIGSGSVVSKNIPKNEIWAGNPIKFIKKCD